MQDKTMPLDLVLDWIHTDGSSECPFVNPIPVYILGFFSATHDMKILDPRFKTVYFEHELVELAEINEPTLLLPRMSLNMLNAHTDPAIIQVTFAKRGQTDEKHRLVQALPRLETRLYVEKALNSKHPFWI